MSVAKVDFNKTAHSRKSDIFFQSTTILLYSDLMSIGYLTLRFHEPALQFQSHVFFEEKEKQTSLLSSSGRSGTSIGREIGEGESTGSEASKQQAGV